MLGLFGKDEAKEAYQSKAFSLPCGCGSFGFMCGRYRLTKRRMLEIEAYYGIDSVHELDLWEREFNIPPT